MTRFDYIAKLQAENTALWWTVACLLATLAVVTYLLVTGEVAA